MDHGTLGLHGKEGKNSDRSYFRVVRVFRGSHCSGQSVARTSRRLRLRGEGQGRGRTSFQLSISRYLSELSTHDPAASTFHRDTPFITAASPAVHLHQRRCGCPTCILTLFCTPAYFTRSCSRQLSGLSRCLSSFQWRSLVRFLRRLWSCFISTGGVGAGRTHLPHPIPR